MAFFDPNDPSKFNYSADQESLAIRQAMARQLMNVPMPQGPVHVPRGAALGNILAQAIGGYMQGKNLQDKKALADADSAQANWMMERLMNPDGVKDELGKQAQAQADATSPVNENIYTHKKPEEVGPMPEGAATSFPVRTPNVFSRALGDDTQPPAIQEEATPGQPSVSDTFNINENALDESQIANQDAKANFLKKALAADRANIMKAGMNGGPKTNALFNMIQAQQAAERNRQAEDAQWKAREVFKAGLKPEIVKKDDRGFIVDGKYVELPGGSNTEWKPVGTPFAVSNGSNVQVFANPEGQTRTVTLTQAGTSSPVVDKKSADAIAEKKSALDISTSSASTNIQRLDRLLNPGPGDPALGNATGIGGGLARIMPWNTDAKMAQQDVEKLVNNVVIDHIAKMKEQGVGVSAFSSDAEGKRLENAVANLDYLRGGGGPNDDAGLRRQLMDIREMMVDQTKRLNEARLRQGMTPVSIPAPVSSDRKASGTVTSVPGYGQKAPTSLDDIIPRK